MRNLNYCIARNGAQTAVGVLMKVTDTTVRLRLLDDREISEPRGHVELRRGTYAELLDAIETYQTASISSFKGPKSPSRRLQIGDPKQRPR